jgi:hypothetical protein
MRPPEFSLKNIWSRAGLRSSLLAAGAVALLAALFALVFSASAVVTPQVSVSSATVAANGDQATVSLDVSSVANLGAFNIHVSYDPAVADALSCAPAPGFFCNANFENNGGATDKVSCGGFSVAGGNGNLNLCNITFQAVAVPEACTALTPTVLEFVSAGAPPAAITHTVANGSFCVLVLGDSNCDGFIGMVDALVTAQYVLALIPSICANNADVNGDGFVTMADALLIAQVIVGLAGGFP